MEGQKILHSSVGLMHKIKSEGISEDFEFRFHKVVECFLALGEWWQREPEMPYERDKNRGPFKFGT